MSDVIKQKADFCRRVMNNVHVRIDDESLHKVKGLLLREGATVSEVFREMLYQLSEDRRLLDKIVKIVKARKANKTMDKIMKKVAAKEFVPEEGEKFTAPNEMTADFLYEMIEQELRSTK